MATIKKYETEDPFLSEAQIVRMNIDLSAEAMPAFGRGLESYAMGIKDGVQLAHRVIAERFARNIQQAEENMEKAKTPERQLEWKQFAKFLKMVHADIASMEYEDFDKVRP